MNSLTLYCKNLLQESLKLRKNEVRRKDALRAFINNPVPENFVKAFYIVRIPTLQYELFARPICQFAMAINLENTNIDIITINGMKNTRI